MLANMWTFSDALPVERATRLLSYLDFQTVVGLVMRGASIVAFEWEPFNEPRLQGCHRASYLLQVSGEAYDAFFNSPVGYRAQYARSVEEGLRANQELIDRLRPRLLAHGEALAVAKAHQLTASLDGTNAKVWIYEREVEEYLGDANPDIRYRPWIDASTDGAGLRAPLASKLVVMGAWLDARDREQRDPRKAMRGEDIHREGFS